MLLILLLPATTLTSDSFLSKCVITYGIECPIFITKKDYMHDYSLVCLQKKRAKKNILAATVSRARIASEISEESEAEESTVSGFWTHLRVYAVRINCCQMRLSPWPTRSKSTSVDFSFTMVHAMLLAFNMLINTISANVVEKCQQRRHIAIPPDNN